MASWVCPNCGRAFTLQDIIPDKEVEEYKSSQLNQGKIAMGVMALIFIGASAVGKWLGIIVGFFLAVPFIMTLCSYISYSNKNLEEWREALSKTWKYQTKLQKGGIALKILYALSKL